MGWIMNSKKFEYSYKDIPSLKKDIVIRSCFSFSFLCIFIWQFIDIIVTAMNSSLTIMQIASALIVIASTLLLSLVSLLYVFKDFRIIAAVKINGRCISSVQMLVTTSKRGFLNLYRLLTQMLTLLTSLILICSITYTILQAAYLSYISFYLPLLLLICMSGFNSIYHINEEMRTQKNVQEYNFY